MVMAIATLCAAIVFAMIAFGHRAPLGLPNAPAALPVTCGCVYLYCMARAGFLVATSWRTLGGRRLVGFGAWAVLLLIPAVAFVAAMMRTVFL
jgi:hypothetical protein